MSQETAGQVGEVGPREAQAILEREPDAVLVDVRSKVEYDYVGHPPQAINIPWKDAPDWRVDPGFAGKVRDGIKALAGGDAPPESRTVLTLCRSGGRSRSAAEELQRHGFRRVVNVAEGFEGDLDQHRHRSNLNGWRFHGLPWEQT